MLTNKSIFLAATLVLVAVVVQAGDPVPYPAGYRHWNHVKTLTLHKGHPLESPFEGIHHVYANEKALSGLDNGKYKDGSIFVFDLLSADTKDKATSEGKRKLIGVMRKDRKRYTSTGGWGFEAFAGDSHQSRIVQDGGTSCYACHTSQHKSDFVFSKWRP